ncbi:MAG: prenyltransferase [Candidatus Omnitrophota bacterium]
MKALQQLFLITRGWSFPISLTAVTLGTAAALEHTTVSIGLYGASLFGACAFHASANAFNDYFDFKHGIDTPQSPTVLYRPHGIFQGLIRPQTLLKLSIGLLALALITGSCLAFKRCVWIWPILLAAVALNFFYTAHPQKNLKYTALGEMAVFLAFGPLLMEGGYAVQTRHLSWNVLFLSIPTGLLVALVLFANNLRDRGFDSAKGIRTLATSISISAGKNLFLCLTFLPYLIIILYVFTGLVRPTALLTLISLPLAKKISHKINEKIPLAADAIASKIALYFNSLLIISLLLNLFLQF